MRLSRARYVTVCQQSLVTAVVLAVAASAAGVRTLDIVPTPGSGTAGTGVGAVVPGQSVLHERERPAQVETTPVTPEVREVEVRTAPATEQDQEQGQEQGQDGAARQEAPRGEGDADEARGGTGERTAPAEGETTDDEGRTVVAESEPERVEGYATVGVTWTSAPDGRQYHDDEISVQVRTKADGAWSGWTVAEYHDEHGPDGSEAERAGERAGTDAVVVGAVDAVQMRASTADGTAPEDLQLALVDPGVGTTESEAPAIDTAELDEPAAADQGADQGDAQGEQGGTASGDTTGEAAGASDEVALSAMRVAEKPTIYSRAQWGANERLRDRGSLKYGTVKTGFVHHTVNANNYSREDVPALLRGIYAYHTQSRGWSDIGYNFLVDRFGRVWEGRYGGVDKAVVGAHTLGYNESSFAMSAIGNFDVATPPQAVVTAYARLFAWKLSLSGIRADATGIKLGGRTFRAINGHRDAGSTACPGRYLYAKLGSIRSAAQNVQDKGGSTAPTPTPTPAPTPAPPSGFVSPTQQPQAWTTQKSGISFPGSRNVMGTPHPDLVVKRADGLIQTVQTGGQAAYAGSTSTRGDWGAKNLVVAVGDVTGDGRGDVLSRHRSNGAVRIHRGDGKGGVGAPGFRRTTDLARAKNILAAGDWDGDGRNDLLVVTSKDVLRVWKGAGNGTFKADKVVARGWAYSLTVVTKDLTGDGRDDVVAMDSARRLVVLPKTASGGLGAPVSRRALGEAPRALGGGAAAGDFSGDGRGDVLVQLAGSRRSVVIPGQNGGVLGSQRFAASDASRGLVRLSLGQMTGGPQADMVGVSTDGRRLVVVAHNGLRNVVPPVSSNLTLPGATQVLAVGDWNGDGHGDIVTREDGGDRLNLRIGNSSGRFSSAKSLGTGWAGITRLAAVGDVDGDGHPDLAGRTSSGELRVFLGDGEEGLAGVRTAPRSLRTFNLVGGAAWAPAGSGADFPSSDGSFVPAGGGTGKKLSGYDWVVGAGDLDGDGRRDLVVRSSTGELWMLPGTSTGLGARRFLGLNLTGYATGG